MKERDRLHIAYRYSKTRFFESLMVILGVSFGVAVLSVILSMIRTVGQDITSPKEPYYHEITVQSKTTRYDWTQPALRIGTTATQELRFEFSDMEFAKTNCPLVKYAYTQSWAAIQLEPASASEKTGESEIAEDDTLPEPEGSGRIPIDSTVNDYFHAYGYKLQAGTWFLPEDIKEGRRVMVLGYRLAKRLFPQKSAAELAGKRFPVKGKTYFIIGVLERYPTEWDKEDTSEWNPNNIAYMPFTANAQGIKDYAPTLFSFYVDDIGRLGDAERQLKAYFAIKYESESLDIRTQLESINENRKTMLPVIGLVFIFAGIIVFLATLNILNLMLARALRRGKSIGIAKAVGSSRSEAFKLVVNEALLLSLTGGIIGMILAFPLSALLKGIMRNSGYSGSGTTFILDPGVALMAFIVTIGISLSISLYPAILASRTNAAEMVKEE